MSQLELPTLYVDAVALATPAAQLVLVNRDPGPDEHGVPIDAPIALELVDTGLDGVDRASVRVWIDGMPAFVGGSVPEIEPAYAGAGAVVEVTDDTLRIVLRPVVPLASLALVAVRVRGATVGGAAALDETYAFVVEDRTAPRVLAAQAPAPRHIRVAFDEPMAPASPASFVVHPRGAPAVPLTVVAAAVDASVVELTVAPEMTPDVRYEVVARGATDVAGNPVQAPFDRATFPGFRPASPPGRRFDLWAMMPRHNRRDDQTGDLRRFLASLQEATDLLLADLDRWPEIFDLARAPARFLDLILADLGNPFAFELSELDKRRLAAVLVQLYGQKGTAKGIENAVRFFLQIDVVAITAFNADTLVLGESELGVDWVLGPSERFARYAFNIQVARILTARERRLLRAIVAYLKPAHTHFVDLLEPLPPATPDHWELGLSELSETTDLH